jgi:hypothetical protein
VNKTPEEAVQTKSGRKHVFPPEMGKEVMDYLLFMETRLFGLTRLDVRSLAFQLATRYYLKNNFSRLKGTVGKDWLHGFLGRHKNTLSKGFSRTNVNNFFGLLESEDENQHFDAHRIYNVDESGLTVDASKVLKVLSLKGRHQVGSVTYVRMYLRC